ncbi:MAG: acylphosphatase [Spirochaetaceae bacterium]|nr:MAG: acylphosphatase [Spirochaetaceae bacterium]
MTAVRVRVHGRVQGVGFRYSTRYKAQELGITGWVRNEFDGTVLVEAEGNEEAIKSFVSWLKTGPPPARVESVDVQKKAPTESWRRFSVR